MDNTSAGIQIPEVVVQVVMLKQYNILWTDNGFMQSGQAGLFVN